jgi:hypothetical protein
MEKESRMMWRRRHRLTIYDKAVFRVCVQGVLDDSWSQYFGAQSMSVEMAENGVASTTLITEALDQAALIGLINYLNSLGLSLLAVEYLPEGATARDRYRRRRRDVDYALCNDQPKR